MRSDNHYEPVMRAGLRPQISAPVGTVPLRLAYRAISACPTTILPEKLQKTPFDNCPKSPFAPSKGIPGV